jgi:hypothetical protein
MMDADPCRRKSGRARNVIERDSDPRTKAGILNSPFVKATTMDLTTELAAIIDCLDAEGIPYALCGGLAVALHGHVRTTQDIDLLIRPEDVDRVFAAVRPLGFHLGGGVIPLGFGEAHPLDVHRISKAVGRELITLDLVLVNPTLEPAWESRQFHPWQGRELCVVSREGLGVMKRLSRRPLDLDDLDQLGIVTDG